MFTPLDLARIPRREPEETPRLGPVSATVLEAGGHLRWAVHLRSLAGVRVVAGELAAASDMDQFVETMCAFNPEGSRVAVLESSLESVLAGRIEVEHTHDQAAMEDIREHLWPWGCLDPLSIKVCSDASVRSTRPGAGLGWVVDVQGDPVGPSLGAAFVTDRLSPAEAEFRAVLAALKEVMTVIERLRRVHPARIAEVVIRSDSRYALGVVHDLMGCWRPDGKVSSKFTNLIDNVRIGLQGIPIRVQWVKGHAGDPMNETADRLALAARRNVECGTEAHVRRRMKQDALNAYLDLRAVAS